METHEVAEQLSDWAGEVLTDHQTGVPPDVKLNVKASSHFIVGRMEGGEAPSSGRRTRGFNLDFSFPARTDTEHMEEVARRVRTALETDPTLGGRFGHRGVEFGEQQPVERDKGTYGDGSALLTLRVRVHDFQSAQ
jgi:hypothetical protein